MRQATPTLWACGAGTPRGSGGQQHLDTAPTFEAHVQRQTGRACSCWLCCSQLQWVGRLSCDYTKPQGPAAVGQLHLTRQALC
jgi:hypothetical protein